MRVFERKLDLDELRREHFEAYQYPCFYDAIDDNFLAGNKIGHVIVLDLLDALVGPEPSEQLRVRIQRLEGNGERHIVLNLEGLTQIDSMGLGEVVRGMVILKRNHGTFPLVNAPEWFQQLVARVKFL